MRDKMEDPLLNGRSEVGGWGMGDGAQRLNHRADVG